MGCNSVRSKEHVSAMSALKSFRNKKKSGKDPTIIGALQVQQEFVNKKSQEPSRTQRTPRQPIRQDIESRPEACPPAQLPAEGRPQIAASAESLPAAKRQRTAAASSDSRERGASGGISHVSASSAQQKPVSLLTSGIPVKHGSVMFYSISSSRWASAEMLSIFRHQGV